MQISDNLKSTLKKAKQYFMAFLRWFILAVIVGLLCGVIGAFFAKSVSFVTHLREQNSWLIYLLPLGGLLIVLLYKLLHVTDVGTNQVFESVRSEKKVPVLLSPAIFIGSVITHLLGGSAGREGAALQLGGSISALIGKLLKLDENTRHILTMCGMGALFSAIFGTPIGACVFALEVIRIGHICSSAFFPALISSITAYSVSGVLGIAPERFALSSVPAFNINTAWRVLIISIIGALISVVFCQAMHLSEKLFKKAFKNAYLRIMVGGAVITLLTVIIGTNDYNGGGIEVINRIFTSGEVRYEAFLIKIIFTAITIGCGYKGGEIIPTLFIGATLGGSLAVLLGLSPAFGAAIGMASLLCGVTNCPIATIFICLEMFGADGILSFALAAVTSFLLSGYSSLYHEQKLFFSKTTEEILDINAK